MKHKGYYNITHFSLLYEPIYKLWKKILCPRGIHLLDEVWNPNEHYLVCDACDLVIGIEYIDDEYVE